MNLFAVRAADICTFPSLEVQGMADLSTQGLLSKIRSDFGTETYFVEVSVLDGNGDKFDVYSGRADDMTPMHLTKVFRNAGCFYMFTVLGIEEDLLLHLDQHQTSIKRR